MHGEIRKDRSVRNGVRRQQFGPGNEQDQNSELIEQPRLRPHYASCNTQTVYTAWAIGLRNGSLCPATMRMQVVDCRRIQTCVDVNCQVEIRDVHDHDYFGFVLTSIIALCGIGHCTEHYRGAWMLREP
eukprot:6214636-Pleurochrysis_carterae.AAC.2